MTDSPVAAPNARTMWKREIPPTPAISSSVSGLARWLSINQSAFWAGFMHLGLHSKRRHCDPSARAAFDSPCSLRTATPEPGCFFRCAENSSEAIAGNLTPIVHTARAFDPTARQAAQRDRLSLGQYVREDDDALSCLEPCQIRRRCRTAGVRACGARN